MLCNECWSELEVKAEAVATSCGHLYCVKCAHAILEQHGTCPMCENLLSKSNVKLATIAQDPAILKLALLGQSPESAMAAALSATNFYIAQQDLYHQYREAAVRKKAQKMQDTCKAKLDEVHSGYQQAKRKYQETLQKKAALEKELNDLQRKYSTKVMQNRKLQDMFKRVHQENEALRRSNSHSGSHTLGHSKSLSCGSNVGVQQTHTQTSPEVDDDENKSGASSDAATNFNNSSNQESGATNNRNSDQSPYAASPQLRSPNISPLRNGHGMDFRADSSEGFLSPETAAVMSAFEGLSHGDSDVASAEAKAVKKLLDGPGF